MIPTNMFRNVSGFVGAGLLVACVADPGAQPLQPTSKSAIQLPALSAANAGSTQSAPQGAAEPSQTAAPQSIGGQQQPSGQQTAPQAEALSDGAKAQPPELNAATPTGGGKAAAEPVPFELPRGTTVLHVGDSFAGALGPDLNRELSERGVRGVLKQEKATYIPTWASRKELSGYLKEYNPDLVLVTLGGNELGIVRPEERAETVQRLVKRFEGIPCVWIGIPLWKDANPTLLEVIRNNVSPCRYLDSNALVPNLERAKDKIHPSLSARKIWASAVVRWLAERRLPNADKPWALK